MNPSLLEDVLPWGMYLPSYSTMLTIGFVIATILLRRWARANGIDPRLIVDFVIWMALWGVVGSRLLHLVADGYFWDYVHMCTDPSQVVWHVDARECGALKGAWDAAAGVCHPIQSNCWAALDVTAGGFAYYGGLIAAALFSIWFIRRHKLPAGKILDMSSWLIILGLAWGRMGCFLASCCFGARFEGPFAVSFPSGSAASRHQWEEGALDTYRHASLHVHPTQLYESIGSLAIAVLVYLLVRPRKRFDGQVFAVSMTAYAALRFGLEYLRRDARGGFGPFSTSQWIAIAIAAFCAWLWVHMRKRARRILTADDRSPTAV